jgi:transposase
VEFLPVSASPRLITPNRCQIVLEQLDVEKLIPDDHPARAIWELVGSLDLEPYRRKIKSVEGSAGRPAFDPHVLISIWVYAYSDGVGSAHEVEELMSHDPAYRWLTGLEVINHHTLSDFRVEHGKELDELFTQVLGVLSSEDLVALKRVTQDGTKIKACASKKRFRREATLRDHLAFARAQVEAMSDPGIDHENARRAKARIRAIRERGERLEKAIAELPKVRELKKSEEERRNARVSETDPEARVMKLGEGGYAPCYNVQLTVDTENDIIVNVGLTQDATDAREMPAAMDKVKERTGVRPEQVVADAGYTNHGTIMAMADREIDFVGSWRDTSAMVDAQYERRGVEPEFRSEAFRYDEEEDKYVCPAGKDLPYISTDDRRPGTTQVMYRASVADCAKCRYRERCHPGQKVQGRNVMRLVIAPQITAYHAKMETEAAKAAYSTRARTAEFPNAWIKAKIGLRQFRTRGMTKTKQEALWAGITYNIQQWIRLIWRPRMAEA